jgi:hypothetical protein
MRERLERGRQSQPRHAAPLDTVADLIGSMDDDYRRI